MPSYKSYWTSLAYHTVTRPSIDAVRHLSKNLTKMYRRNRLIRRGINPDNRKNVLKITRGPTAGSGKLWSKYTLAGQKRRDKAAALARTLQRPIRSKTGDVRAIQPLKTKAAKYAPRASQRVLTKQQVSTVRRTPVGSVSSAVVTSKTMGGLRRKLTVRAVKDVTGRITPKHPTGNVAVDRKRTADDIRAIRKHMGPEYLRKAVKKAKQKKLAEAAREIVNRTSR